MRIHLSHTTVSLLLSYMPYEAYPLHSHFVGTLKGTYGAVLTCNFSDTDASRTAYTYNVRLQSLHLHPSRLIRPFDLIQSFVGNF